MAGSPARLPGTVNTSLTYVSTGVIELIDSNAGAGPTVVGHRMISHFSWIVCGARGECNIFSAENTSSKDLWINFLTR
jgi:hypothetical protein